MNFGRAVLVRFFYEDADSYSLLDIKHIFIFAAVRGNFFFLHIAVKVKNINIGKGIHQGLAHTAEGGVIQVAVVGNKAQDALPCFLYPPLPKANEFHIVILQPVLTFAQRLPINHLVIFNKLANPGKLLLWLASLRVCDIRTLALADIPEYGGLPSTTMIGFSFLISAAALASSTLFIEAKQCLGFLECFLKRIGQVDPRRWSLWNW